jgi:hypothetical protein
VKRAVGRRNTSAGTTAGTSCTNVVCHQRRSGFNKIVTIPNLLFKEVRQD